MRVEDAGITSMALKGLLERLEAAFNDLDLIYGAVMKQGQC